MKKLLTVLQKIVLIVTQKNFITQTVKNLLDIYKLSAISLTAILHSCWLLHAYDTSQEDSGEPNAI